MILLNCIGLMILGASLLWAVNLFNGGRRRRGDDVWRQVLTVLGWVFLFGGLTGAIATTPWLLWSFVAPSIVIIVIMTVLRYRRSEQRALALVISLATQRGIPLPQAIRAFADDSNNEQGLRALRLASLLESGIPLPDALRNASVHMPAEIRAAVDYGEHLGEMGPALQRVIDKDEFYESHRESIIEKSAYLLAIIFFGAVVLSFIMLKIVPSFNAMFQDFELELPTLTQTVVAVSRQASVVFVFLFPFLALLLIGGILAYFRCLPTGVPLLGQLTLRANVATALRLLSLTVKQNRSILSTIAMMSSSFPHGLLRARLKTALMGMNNGQHWCDSLRHAGIYKRVDASVLKAAERAGNLAWALDEIAESSLRRSAYRNVAILNVLFPVGLLAIGIFAGVIFIGLFMPVMSLIINLSH